MNCKQGDLAVVVRAKGENLGRIVTCLRIATDADLLANRVMREGRDFWVIDRPLIARDVLDPIRFLEVLVAPDHILRPIRDPGDDAVDEMVQRVGQPDGVAA